MIRDISLRVLLILSLLLTGLVPVMILSLISMNSSKNLLMDEAFRQLETIRDLKKIQITDYFNERLSNVIVFSENPYIKKACRDLRDGFYKSGGVKGNRFFGLKNEEFEAPPDYVRIHDVYFPTLKKMMERYRYYDLFLMDPEFGDTVFTVKKESDFGTRISGVDSSLKDVWMEVVRTGRPALSDTKPYSPSANAPAQFLAAPILEEGFMTGVVAVQISIDSVGEIMRLKSGKWKSSDAYLVGKDKKMRSDSHSDPAEHSVISSFYGSVPENGVNTAASVEALAGRTGKKIIHNFQSREVLCAYAPINILGIQWAILAEVEKSEIEKNISAVLNTKIVFLFLISLALVLFFSMTVSVFLSRGINGTIQQIELLIRKVLKGDLKPRINPDLVAADFRAVARSSNQLIDTLEGEREEKELLEKHLRASRKLRSIGVLAGGIAHDFNNILTSILTNLHIIRENSEFQGMAEESHQEIQRSLNAASDLVRQILTFSSTELSGRTRVNLANAILEVVQLLKGSIPANVSVVTDFLDQEMSTSGIPSQINQVFLNLILNACHSIGPVPGSVRITTERLEVPAENRGTSENFCRVRVRDTGNGMSPETMKNIFEPFFSTKPADEGSGLGLSIVHGIVMNMGGRIEVESAEGEGTVFIIDFPLFETPGGDPKTAGLKGSDIPVFRCLLADDDEGVRNSVSRWLGEIGLQVTCAGDGKEALEIFREHPERYDLVLTDFDMPECDGIQLQKKLSELKCAVPVVLCTGAGNMASIREKFDLSGFADVLIKPFSHEKLVEIIRSHLRADIP